MDVVYARKDETTFRDIVQNYDLDCCMVFSSPVSLHVENSSALLKMTAIFNLDKCHFQYRLKFNRNTTNLAICGLIETILKRGRKYQKRGFEIKLTGTSSLAKQFIEQCKRRNIVDAKTNVLN